MLKIVIRVVLKFLNSCILKPTQSKFNLVSTFQVKLTKTQKEAEQKMEKCEGGL